MSDDNIYNNNNDTNMNAQLDYGLQLVRLTNCTEEQQTSIMHDTLDKWRAHINAGFLKYRKSVSDMDNYALLDWYDAFPGTPWFNDHRGKTYLDLLGGYGIYNVGRRHPKVVEMVATQLNKQALHSQELLDPLRAQCAHILSMVMPRMPGKGALKNVFFTNSGTEAVEACLKMAMAATGKSSVIACVNAFHGKTLGSLSCTSKSVFRAPFLASLNRTYHTPFNNSEALSQLFEVLVQTGERVAALIIEPIQGEGGIHVGTTQFLQTARTLCDKYGSLLIFDEVQSGMGRTGKWWACDHANVVPDLMAIGKAFGGGVMPVGACVGTDEVWNKYTTDPFLFTTTFGGNPLAMAAAIATLDVIHRERLCEAAENRGKQFLIELNNILNEFPDIIREVRGRGLMLGIEFQTNEMGIAFAKQMLQQRVLTAGTLAYAKTVRIEPALTITKQDIEWAVGVMRNVISNISQAPRSKL